MDLKSINSFPTGKHGDISDTLKRGEPMTEEELLDLIEQETGYRPPPHIPAQKRLRSYRIQQKKMAELEEKRKELLEEMPGYHRTSYTFTGRAGKRTASQVEAAASRREKHLKKIEAIGRELEQIREALGVVERMLAILPLGERELLQGIYIQGRSITSMSMSLYLSERALRGRIDKQMERLNYWLLREGL
jgi:hypothetical protein